jgi:hypothetical protein
MASFQEISVVGSIQEEAIIIRYNSLKMWMYLMDKNGGIRRRQGRIFSILPDAAY